MRGSAGAEIRRGRVLRPDTGRTVMVAYSHGLLRGPQPGMRTVTEMTRFLAQMRAADAVMLSPGLAPAHTRLFAGRDRPGLVLQADWQSMSRRGELELPYPEGQACSVLSPEDALRHGADLIMSYLWVGADDPRDERDEIARNAWYARECERAGLPLMIEPRALRSEQTPDGHATTEVVAMHARIAAEIGCDMVKVLHPGSSDALAEIVESTPVPVLVAGGRALDDPDAYPEVAGGSVAAGAAGVVVGRNLFEHADPKTALAAVVDAVHSAPQA